MHTTPTANLRVTAIYQMPLWCTNQRKPEHYRPLSAIVSPANNLPREYHSTPILTELSQAPAMTKKPIKGAVLLAAGRGKRLRPYTDSTPKPLLPVNGVPTLDLYFKSLVAAGITHTVLVVHHLAEQIEHYASEVKKRFGIHCTTVKQGELDGTASALEAVLTESHHNESLKTIICEPFLLIATDYLIPDTFIPDLLAFHIDNEEDITVSIKLVPKAELSTRSSIRFASDGSITEVVEKPAPGQAPSDYSANLAYVLPVEVVALLSDVKCSARGEREVQTAINAYLASQGTARGLIQTAPNEWTPDLLTD